MPELIFSSTLAEEETVPGPRRPEPPASSASPAALAVAATPPVAESPAAPAAAPFLPGQLRGESRRQAVRLIVWLWGILLPLSVALMLVIAWLQKGGELGQFLR
jgi:hypothetical protein